MSKHEISGSFSHDKGRRKRRAAIFAAIEAVQVEIQDHEHALAALEVIYFGEEMSVEVPEPAKVGKTKEKEARGSTRKARKRGGQSTPWTPERRAKHEAKKAAAGGLRAGPPFGDPTAEKAPAAAPVSAHEALKDQTEREVSAASNGPGATGSLSGLKLVPAIRSILYTAARPLTSTEILDRLRVGGYQHTAAGPLVNSVTGSLPGMGLQYERRAGRNFYDPITKEGEE